MQSFFSSVRIVLTVRLAAASFHTSKRRAKLAAEKAGSQNYWLAKAFIVLGDSFADRGDFVQAEATYESILEGYEPVREDDDVLEQVRSRLNNLKTSKR